MVLPFSFTRNPRFCWRKELAVLPVEWRAENNELIQEVFLWLDVACRCLLPPLNTVYVLLKTVALGKLCIDWRCHKLYVNNKGMAPNQKINPRPPGSSDLRNVSTTCSQKPEKGSFFYVKRLIKWNKAEHKVHHNLSWGWLLNHQAHSFVCILLMTSCKWGMSWRSALCPIWWQLRPVQPFRQGTVWTPDLVWVWW